MPETPLILGPFRKALGSLDSALAQTKDEFLRDSVIQRFEYTYEIGWKSLKRYLEEQKGLQKIDRLTRKDLFRVAFEKGLIGDVEAWFAYHKARNETSHAYNEATADEVYDTARKFAADARRLLEELERRGDA